MSISYIIKNSKKLLNNILIIKGWIRSKRISKIGICFLSIYDGSSFNDIQIIIDNKLVNNFNLIKNKLNIGCSIFVKGILIKSIGKKQEYEIKANKINIIGHIYNPDTYIMSNKKNSIEFLRKNLHLRIRDKLFLSISRIRNSIFYKIHNFMNKHNFFWIPTPIITSSDTEGNSKLFNISTLYDNNFNNDKNNLKDFFGKKVFLTVSGQLNLESYACALSKVYTFSPVFRAENSNTRKHLSEFWMFELEVSFSKLKYIIKLSELLIKDICIDLVENNIDDINFLYKKNNLNIKYLYNLIKNDFNQISYSKAIKILNKSKFNNIKWGSDISSDNEKYLLNYFNSPLVIKNFPKNIKPFYMKLNSDNTTVSSMDILMPNIGEVIGGSEREYKFTKLKEKIEKNINKNYYNWYLDLRKYGSVPHSGFGLGFERLISSLTGIKNIKDIIPFPRYPGNFDI